MKRWKQFVCASASFTILLSFMLEKYLNNFLSPLRLLLVSMNFVSQAGEVNWISGEQSNIWRRMEIKKNCSSISRVKERKWIGGWGVREWCLCLNAVYGSTFQIRTDYTIQLDLGHVWAHSSWTTLVYLLSSTICTKIYPRLPKIFTDIHKCLHRKKI